MGCRIEAQLMVSGCLRKPGAGASQPAGYGGQMRPGKRGRGRPLGGSEGHSAPQHEGHWRREWWRGGSVIGACGGEAAGLLRGGAFLVLAFERSAERSAGPFALERGAATRGIDREWPCDPALSWATWRAHPAQALPL